jgi:hypothetical protein
VEAPLRMQRRTSTSETGLQMQTYIEGSRAEMRTIIIISVAFGKPNFQITRDLLHDQ